MSQHIESRMSEPAILLCRRDSLQTDFVIELAKSCIIFDIPHCKWTVEKNIDFIHSIVNGRQKIMIAINSSFKGSAFEMTLFKKKVEAMPLIARAIEGVDGTFCDALLNELYRGVNSSASMLAIELNILLGFGYRIANITAFEREGFYVFEMRKRRWLERFLCCTTE